MTRTYSRNPFVNQVNVDDEAEAGDRETDPRRNPFVNQVNVDELLYPHGIRARQLVS